MPRGRLLAQDFQTEFEKVFAWLPKNYPETEVADILGNLNLYPKVCPTTEIALDVYQSLLKVKLANANLKKRGYYQIPEQVVSNSRNFSEALLIFLDGTQPQGIFDLAIDQEKLATCFCFEGRPEKLQNLILATVEINFGVGTNSKIQILSDQIVRIPLDSKTLVKVTLTTFGNFKISGEKKISQEFSGAELGLIFDGRGRPIIPPGAFDRERRAKSWRQALEYSPGFLPS